MESLSSVRLAFSSVMMPMPELYGKSLRARIAKRYAGSMSESQTMPETSEKGEHVGSHDVGERT